MTGKLWSAAAGLLRSHRAAARLLRAMAICLLLATPLALGGCFHFEAGIVPPTPAPGTSSLPAAALTLTTSPLFTVPPTLTPAPVPTHLPTPLANARVTGQVCQAGVTVYLRSCCPPYEARETSDARGFFAFEGLTEGTFTVTCGLYSEVVTLETHESQVDVDLCPPPTHPP